MTDIDLDKFLDSEMQQLLQTFQRLSDIGTDDFKLPIMYLPEIDKCNRFVLTKIFQVLVENLFKFKTLAEENKKNKIVLLLDKLNIIAYVLCLIITSEGKYKIDENTLHTVLKFLESYEYFLNKICMYIEKDSYEKMDTLVKLNKFLLPISESEKKIRNRSLNEFVEI